MRCFAAGAHTNTHAEKHVDIGPPTRCHRLHLIGACRCSSPGGEVSAAVGGGRGVEGDAAPPASDRRVRVRVRLRLRLRLRVRVRLRVRLRVKVNQSPGTCRHIIITLA